MQVLVSPYPAQPLTQEKLEEAYSKFWKVSNKNVNLLALEKLKKKKKKKKKNHVNKHFVIWSK